MRPFQFLAAGILMLAAGCSQPDSATTMSDVAEQYVKLVLAVGEHDPAYVDAYYGPAEWRAAVKAAPPSLPAIETRAGDLARQLAGMELPAAAGEMQRLRKTYLQRQLEAVQAYARILQGEKLSFDAESRALYDAVAPHYGQAHYAAILAELAAALPGDGPLPERYEQFRARYVIPPDKLDAVFQAALAEARRRTREHVVLPDNERFEIEYVTDKPWSGYNWYQGDAHSLIQLNTEFPIHIDRAIDLAAHEGYPGHHVYNTLLEQYLVRERGWMEFSVYALFSPQSLIAEGGANYGIEVAFPGEDKLAFMRDVLFPLAGLDPDTAERYVEVGALLKELGYAGNEAARAYLDGEIDAEEAARRLHEYTLAPPDRARQRVRFFDTYRSYVINYNLGKDLVARYVECRGGTADNPQRRWEVFAELLASPRLPSGLICPET